MELQSQVTDGTDGVAEANQVEPSSFLNNEFGIAGRTVSTKSEPNTSSQFNFWVADEHEAKGILEIGNIMAALADDGSDLTFGVVTEMRSYSDVESFIADFLSHNFGEAEVETRTDVSEVVVVTCDVMRNLSNTTKPVGRSRVYFPNSLGIRFAYGIVDEEGESIFAGASIPLGIFENGDNTKAPISVDEDFLIGPEGAHLNVSGISGLASKTSAVQFTLKSLLTHKSEDSSVGVVMFNVKSNDLLYVDQRNPAVESEDSPSIYNSLNIPDGPFDEARFFAPADPDVPGQSQSLRRLPTEPFQWDLPRIKDDIPSLFDPMDWDDKMDGVWARVRQQIEQRPLHTYSQMLNWIDGLINQASSNNNTYPYGQHIRTWQKMYSRLQRFPGSYQGLIATAGGGTAIPWHQLRDESVYVVDIQMLNDRGQRLVFGRAIRELSNMLESEEGELDHIVVFVDELNKFAPAGKAHTPLKSQLVDITARGRSIGLVLFGAEQFASSVEKEVVENSSTYLFGRTETNELRTPNYSAFSDEVKAKLTMLPQGQLLAKFAKFPQPIFLRFPYPPCLPGNEFESEDHEQQDELPISEHNFIGSLGEDEDSGESFD